MLHFFTRGKLIKALLLYSIITLKLNAQQLKITDFVLFGGQKASATPGVITPGAPGFAVNIASSATITNGRIGSYNLIKATGKPSISSNLNSGGTISIGDGTLIYGSITAQNTNNDTGYILKMGGNTYISKNIDVNGNIYIKNGSVGGNVTHPAGTTYIGPKPGGKEYIKTPNFPVLPLFPAVTAFTTKGTDDVKLTRTIKPGYYRNMQLNGNQKVTFSGAGDYYFKSIHNKNNNTLRFDFKNATGNIRIYVEGDVNLDKTSSKLINGGAASRIYLEVHGNGSTTAVSNAAFSIASDSTIGSSWTGTIYAPFASINIGLGTGTSYITGALWSTAQVNIRSGAIIKFAPFTGLRTTDSLIVPGYVPPPNGKSTDLIGPELSSLCQTNSNSPVSSDIYRITAEGVLIEVFVKPGHYNDAFAKLKNQYGMTGFVNSGTDSLTITGKIPVNQLCLLNNDAEMKNYITGCRPVYSPITNTGLATTGGDTSVHADVVRNAFHLTGAGIKVGVLSDSYNTIPGNPALTDVINGDLPGIGNLADTIPVEVLEDYPYGRATDEGRAMLQHIHDLAPGAKLAFRTGFISESDFANGITHLQEAGCKVITDDVTYITAPFFKDGLAAQAVNKAKSLSVSYFSAAGNFGSKSYEAVFSPAPAPAGITGQAHNFSGADVADILQNDSLQPGNYTIVLQWEDSIYSLGQGGALNDFDIYLANDDGSILFGMNRPNLGSDPIEVLPFTVRANTRTNIMIVRAAGTTPNIRLKFIVYRGELKFNEFATGTSTIVGQANAAGAMAVGAARYTRTPAYGITPALIESFSSTGGTPVYGVVRQKPDFAAPDGGNSTVNFGSLDIEGDGIPNFFGTSAAAPHAAGVAALILEGKKRFYNKVYEPDSVRYLLSSTASDMTATPGFDNVSGYGFIQADSAVGSFAAPTPELDSLLVPSTGAVPGSSIVTITLKGKYFQPSSIVTVGGVPIPTTILTSTKATALIKLPAGNPLVRMYTPPITPSGLDGQYSQPLYFFSVTKQHVTVIADNKTKRYGEQIPTFTSTVLINGVPLDTTGVSLDSLDLNPIIYTTPATSTSNVGLYYIHPAFGALTSQDSLIFQKYDFTFQDGVLFNNRMPLLITPKDSTLNYGDKISDFHFNYTLNDSLIPVGERADFLSNLDSVHHSTINNDVVAFVDGRNIVNGRTLTDADLQNMGVMASGRSIANGRNIVNGVEVTDTTKVVDVPVQCIYNYQVDSAAAPLVSGKNIVNGRAIVNGRNIVNGTAQVNGRNIVNGSSVLNSTNVDDTSNQNVIVVIDGSDVSASINVISSFTSLNMITGITAGDFKIVPAALLSDNFDIRYGLGVLKILPAMLTVQAKDTFIFQGDSLPAFTSNITGLRNGDTVVSGPSYTINPAYNNKAGSYTITPSNVVLDCADCYNIAYNTGTLYVNPKGTNAINLKPYLICVDTLINDPTGLKYIATFGCSNDNATTLYIPKGSGNFLSGTGAATAVGNITEYFEPEGSNTCQIKFNGQKLTWTIKSFNNFLYKTATASAYSTSPGCGVPSFSSAASARVVFAQVAKVPATVQTGVAPNPTRGKFVITTNNGKIDYKNLYITDVAGKMVIPQTVAQRTYKSIEVGLPANAANGVYFVRVKIDNDYKILRIVKM